MQYSRILPGEWKPLTLTLRSLYLESGIINSTPLSDIIKQKKEREREGWRGGEKNKKEKDEKSKREHGKDGRCKGREKKSRRGRREENEEVVSLVRGERDCDRGARIVGDKSKIRAGPL